MDSPPEDRSVDLREAEPADARDVRGRDVPAGREGDPPGTRGDPDGRARERRRRGAEPGTVGGWDRGADAPARDAARAGVPRRSAGHQCAFRQGAPMPGAGGYADDHGTTP